jgi:hypothetical protein
MSTRILTGKYLSGYTLTSAWTGVQVNASAVVAGTVGANGVYVAGSPGGIALDLPNAFTAVNHGFIEGGAGGNGGVNDYNGGAGGAGGVGVDLAFGGTLTNTDAIYGGAGGTGGYGGNLGGAGGAGGYAAVFGGGGILTNTGVISGGRGGDAGGGAHGTGNRGLGGGGAYFSQPGTVHNQGAIRAGNEGSGGGGGFHAGVRLESGGRIVNGSSTNHTASIGGDIGVFALGPATIVNYGDIYGHGYYHSIQLLFGGRVIAEPGANFGGGGAYAQNAAVLELAGGSGTFGFDGVNASVTGSISGNFGGFSSYVLDAGGSWTISGVNTVATGHALTSSALLTLAAGASVTVADGASFAAQGHLINGGTIALASTASHSDLVVMAGGLNLYGGQVDLSGPGARIHGVSAAASFFNDGTITGQGWLGLSSLILDNDSSGVIEAVGKQGLVVAVSGYSGNFGMMESAAGSVLTIRDSSIAQTPTHGTIAALNGGRVNLSGDIISSGTLSQTGTGVFNINGNGVELSGSYQAITIDGVIQVLAGIALTLDGAIVNSGKINTFGGAHATKLVVGADGVTLTGGGQVNTKANVNNIIVGAAAGDTLTNVDNRIAGAGNIGDKSMVLVNQAKGTILGNSAVTLTLDTGTSTIANAGLIESASTGQVVVRSAVANTGSLFAASGTLTLDGVVTGTGGAKIKTGVLNIAAKFGEAVTFLTGATGQLRLTDFTQFSGAVAGFSHTGANSIDLAGFTKTGAKASYAGTTVSGTLTVTNGTQTAKVHLTGDYTAATFTLASDGHGGVLVKDPSAPLAQATAAFGPHPPPQLAAALVWRAPRLPVLHVQA